MGVLGTFSLSLSPFLLRILQRLPVVLDETSLGAMLGVLGAFPSPYGCAATLNPAPSLIVPGLLSVPPLDTVCSSLEPLMSSPRPTIAFSTAVVAAVDGLSCAIASCGTAVTLRREKGNRPEAMVVRACVEPVISGAIAHGDSLVVHWQC